MLLKITPNIINRRSSHLYVMRVIPSFVFYTNSLLLNDL
jgi:hypothetical protein